MCGGLWEIHEVRSVDKTNVVLMESYLPNDQVAVCWFHFLSPQLGDNR
jgi:hypothetical protein